MSDALYERQGESFLPTELTTSPWSPDHCHGGPPAALLARAIQLLDPAGLHLARITVEMLRPIPRIPVVVATSVVRPGKRVELSTAELSSTDGEVLLRASAWRIRHRTPLTLPDASWAGAPSLPGPDGGATPAFRGPDYVHYYADAQERREVSGRFDQPGPASMWFRLTVPLVAGEETTPEQRVVAAADSANGISSVASFEELLFINSDLTVSFARQPVGEWVGLDARSHLDPAGRGLSDTTLFDENGYVGRTTQTLFVEER